MSVPVMAMNQQNSVVMKTPDKNKLTHFISLAEKSCKLIIILDSQDSFIIARLPSCPQQKSK